MTADEIKNIIAAGLICEHIELRATASIGTPPSCRPNLKASAPSSATSGSTPPG